nr:MAG TPA: hypothetical protein [Crassvirales sp.]
MMSDFIFRLNFDRFSGSLPAFYNISDELSTNCK